MRLTPDLKAAFARDGFVILPALVGGAALDALCTEADRLLRDADERGGVRNGLMKSAILRDSGPALEIATSLLGSEARVTKLTLFDKSPAANWKVPFHQDLTISVAERGEVDGFGPWSTKDGVPHVQPPIQVLQQVVAIRIHLDATPADHGALRVLAGSHRLGRLTAEEMASLRQRLSETVCPVPLGGAMAMSPLLVHASSSSTSPDRRRVLHYEFSSCALPGGLAWAY